MPSGLTMSKHIAVPEEYTRSAKQIDCPLLVTRPPRLLEKVSRKKTTGLDEFETWNCCGSVIQVNKYLLEGTRWLCSFIILQSSSIHVCAAKKTCQNVDKTVGDAEGYALNEQMCYFEKTSANCSNRGWGL